MSDHYCCKKCGQRYDDCKCTAPEWKPTSGKIVHKTEEQKCNCSICRASRDSIPTYIGPQLRVPLDIKYIQIPVNIQKYFGERTWMTEEDYNTLYEFFRLN